MPDVQSEHNLIKLHIDAKSRNLHTSNETVVANDTMSSGYTVLSIIFIALLAIVIFILIAKLLKRNRAQVPDSYRMSVLNSQPNVQYISPLPTLPLQHLPPQWMQAQHLPVPVPGNAQNVTTQI